MTSHTQRRHGTQLTGGDTVTNASVFMFPYRLYHLRSGLGCTATLVVETTVVDPGKKSKGAMKEEDSGHRASSEDDSSSVYHSTASHDGRVSPVSAEWDGDTRSNTTARQSVSPFWLADELIDKVSEFKATHRRDLSTTSSKTLTNGGSDTDSQARLHSSSLSEADRYATLADLLIDSAPHLRHLATVRMEDSKFKIASDTPRHQLVTPVEEQRHPGKPGVRFANTRPYKPDLAEDSDEQSQQSSTTTVAEGASDNQLLHGIPLLLLIIGLSLVVFLISIDRTIITTVS